MEFIKKLIFFSFSLFILILFVWALYIPKQDIKDTISQTLEEQKGRLDLFYKGVTFQETSNGVKYWEIKAKTSSVNNDLGIATLESTEGTFFSRGKPTLKFIAPKAVWQINKKEIFLYKPTGFDANADKKHIASIYTNHKAPSYFELPARYAGNGRGFFFKAENLSWSIKDKKIVCDNGIWLKKGEISGLAKILQADVGLEKVMISGDPKVYLTNDVIALLEAKKFEIDNPTNRLTAKDNVKLTANNIVVKTKIATYEQETNLVKLSGGVSALYKNYKSWSKIASYDIKKQLMTLSDKAVLKRGSSILSGNSVIINIKSKTFSVKGKSKIVVPEKELTREAI